MDNTGQTKERVTFHNRNEVQGTEMKNEEKDVFNDILYE